MNTETIKKLDFIDLKAQQKRIRASIDRRIATVLDHGAYIMGPEVGELEKRLASYVGTKHCVACSSGTDALLMPLMALGVGPNDVIFTTPFTFIATAEVISLLGARPVFVDIDPGTYNIDPNLLEKAIVSLSKQSGGGRMRGIIPVNLFGQPADYDAINAIARKHQLFVLEDAAQSFGASYKGKKSCSLSQIGATSFFPAKPLGCYGDGGAIFTNDDALNAALHSIRVHGQGDDKYNNVRIGINGRLDTMQAAVLLAKMEVFEEEILLRNKVASRYTEALKKKYTTPFVAPDCVSAWAQYSLLTNGRDGLTKKLKERGVPTAIYYPKPLHLQEAFRDLGYKSGEFPVTERIAGSIFSIPMYPYLDPKDQDIIVDSLMS